MSLVLCYLQYSRVFSLSLLGSGSESLQAPERGHWDKMSVSLRNSGKQSHCLNNLLPVM